MTTSPARADAAHADAARARATTARPARNPAMATTDRARPHRPAPEPPTASTGQGTPDPGTPPAPDPVASLTTSQAQTAYRAVSGLLATHRDLLPSSLKAELGDLYDRLSERLCPYTTADLDARKNKLNEQFPDYEHWYIRSGTAVIWCDRKKAAAQA